MQKESSGSSGNTTLPHIGLLLLLGLLLFLTTNTSPPTTTTTTTTAVTTTTMASRASPDFKMWDQLAAGKFEVRGAFYRE